MYQVLVIDDDKLARKGLISLIPWEKYGMEVAGDVANGALALQFIETHPLRVGVYLRVQGAGNFHGLYCAFRT